MGSGWEVSGGLGVGGERLQRGLVILWTGSAERGHWLVTPGQEEVWSEDIQNSGRASAPRSQA